MSGAIGWVDHCKDEINGAPVLISDAGGGSAFDVLAFDPAYPARNCLTPDVSRVTRINFERNASALFTIGVLHFELSASNIIPIQIIAALNVRLPSSWTSVYVQVLTAASGLLETTSTYTQTVVVPIPGTEDRYDLFWILDELQYAADIRLVFDIPALVDDYIEIGRMWAGPAVVFPCGVGVEWSMTGVDPSRIYRSEGGGYAAFQYPTRKVLSVTKNGLTYDEAMGGNTQAFPSESLRNIFLSVGISSPIVLISNDDTQHEAQTGSIYGLLSSIPSIDHYGRLKFGASMRIEQLR